MKIIKKPVGKIAVVVPKRSKLEVLDIPLDLLIDSEENPNEQDEATFDQLVEGMRVDGFDEPVLVVPVRTGKDAGKYLIASGHHRVKAARVIGMDCAPCIVKDKWTDTDRKIALVRRNHLKGRTNPQKFTRLFNELEKKNDAAILKAKMGFTEEGAFKALYKQVEKNLSPSQKKKLAEAKERITSVDGLSSALNSIFKEQGTDLDHGFMIFSFAGQSHHYVECDKQLHQLMAKLEDKIRDRGLLASDVFKHLLANPDLSRIKPSDTVKTRIQGRGAVNDADKKG